MRFACILSVLAVLGCASPLPAVPTGLERDPCATAVTLTERERQYCSATALGPRLAVTAAHCVGRRGSVQYGREWMPAYPAASVVARDEQADLVLLRLSEPVVPWGYLQLYRDLRDGDAVTVAGRRSTVILARARWVTSDSTGSRRSAVWVDTELWPGESGLPLCDRFGAVVGIGAGPDLEDETRSYFAPTSAIVALLERTSP